MKNMQKRYFVQDGVKYDIFNLPENFVIKGNIDLSHMDLTELPDLSKVTVCGAFDCSRNMLKRLNGAPERVELFDCSFNELQSLANGPKKARFYNCSWNRLKDLVGAPQEAEEFICSYNDLESLDGSMKKVRVYDCSMNKLKSLMGAPREVVDFKCSFNELRTLANGPKKVDYYKCSNNNQLTSVENHIEHCKNLVCDNTPVYKELVDLYGKQLQIINGKMVKQKTL